MIKKALVCMAVEKSLLNIGVPTYEKVIEQLKKKYDCYLPDCYEHPEYLNQIFKELFGDSHKAIVDVIRKALGEFADQKPIARFLQVIDE